MNKQGKSKLYVHLSIEDGEFGNRKFPYIMRAYITRTANFSANNTIHAIVSALDNAWWVDPESFNINTLTQKVSYSKVRELITEWYGDHIFRTDKVGVVDYVKGITEMSIIDKSTFNILGPESKSKKHIAMIHDCEINTLRNVKVGFIYNSVISYMENCEVGYIQSTGIYDMFNSEICSKSSNSCIFRSI